MRSEVRRQRRRNVLVILAVLGVMLLSMAVGAYMYVSDPNGLTAVFPAGAQESSAPSIVD